jgi:hypothetical protein
MYETKQLLVAAEQKAKELFQTIEDRGLIVAGKPEKTLCDEIVKIAREDFGVRHHWGKKIVRAGINTLQPYRADPPTWLFKKTISCSSISILFLKAGKRTWEEPMF